MCKKANGSVFKECYEAIKASNGHKQLTNREIRSILAKKGGCMNPKALHLATMSAK